MDWTFVLALGGAVLGAASVILHVVAPKTSNTLDDKLAKWADVLLGEIRKISPPVL